MRCTVTVSKHYFQLCRTNTDRNFPPLSTPPQPAQPAPPPLELDEESQLQLALSLSKEEHQQVATFFFLLLLCVIIDPTAFLARSAILHLWLVAFLVVLLFLLPFYIYDGSFPGKHTDLCGLLPGLLLHLNLGRRSSPSECLWARQSWQTGCLHSWQQLMCPVDSWPVCSAKLAQRHCSWNS